MIHKIYCKTASLSQYLCASTTASLCRYLPLCVCGHESTNYFLASMIFDYYYSTKKKDQKLQKYLVSAHLVILQVLVCSFNEL